MMFAGLRKTRQNASKTTTEVLNSLDVIVDDAVLVEVLDGRQQ